MLFKKIRQQLVRDGHFKNYLFYAVGEIVLVVFSILIALTVNNWNEGQKKERLAKEFISEIKYDIRLDTTVFNQVIRQIDTATKYKVQWLQNRRLDTLAIKELEGMVLSQYYNIKINTGAYSRMKASNVWTLNDYREIFEHISDYYNFNKTYLDNFNRWEAISHEKETDFWNNQDEFEIELYIGDSIPVLQDTAERKEQLVNILNSPKGRNYLKTSLFRDKTMQEMYEQVSNAGSSVLKEIDERLKD